MSKVNHSAQWIDHTLPLLNYIAAASLYLKQNQLLETELTQNDIKDRILGHWGTVPGLNLLYLAISATIANHHHKDKESLLITGPGHGAPAILAGTWLDDSLSGLYDGKYALSAQGVKKLIHDFSWPGGFQSHVTPHIPGSIHEGGELGYSLGIAFGTIMDNPDLITYCIVGDGEAETGTLAASWQSNKFINPHNDGAVIPILHLNGYKISGPTILATHTNEELTKLYEGLGYEVLIIDQYTSDSFIEDTVSVLAEAYENVKALKASWKPGKTARWPMIIFRSMKGWTGPEYLGDTKIEDNNLSHGIPLKKPKTDQREFNLLKDWLESYKIQSFFDGERLVESATEGLPAQAKRLSQAPYANRKPTKLRVPDLIDFDNESQGRGSDQGNVLLTSSDYLAALVQRNPHQYRVFSPDESESNKLESLLEVSSRCYQWPVRSHDDYIDCHGQVVEILSEQVLQTWYQGYALTGRHGIFISYESFFHIIASQIDQYIKFRKTLDEISWRKPQHGMTYLATSTLWRQEHNGYTHQNPSLINSLMGKQTNRVRLYFPISTNTLLATLHETNVNDSYVNYITAGKTDFAQFLTLEESLTAVREGSTVWDWYSDKNPDIVFVSIGDYQHQETLAAIDWLRENIPGIRIRLINVQHFTPEGIPGLTNERDVLDKLTEDKPIIVNFHGYPEVIKQLFFGSSVAKRMTILGYLEKGGTTTPFDMQVLNQASRYHMALFAAQKLESNGTLTAKQANEIEQNIEKILNKHNEYIRKHGDDIPEVRDWKPANR